MSREIRATRYELQAMTHELQATSHKPQCTSYEIQDTRYEPQDTSHDIRATSYEPRPQTKSTKLRAMSDLSNPHVSGKRPFPFFVCIRLTKKKLERSDGLPWRRMAHQSEYPRLPWWRVAFRAAARAYVLLFGLEISLNEDNNIARWRSLALFCLSVSWHWPSWRPPWRG